MFEPKAKKNLKVEAAQSQFGTRNLKNNTRGSFGVYNFTLGYVCQIDFGLPQILFFFHPKLKPRKSGSQ